MHLLHHADITHLLHIYGYVAIASLVALEGMGIPFPGELTLVSAAILAGRTHDLNIVGVVAAAALGAVVGDNTGFWLGRWLGYRILLRYGHFLRLTESRIKLGQYLFLRWGFAVVFCARFVTVLRMLSGFVAGTNRMPWRRFVVFNALGGTLWALVYGSGAYALGHETRHVFGPAGLSLAIVALAAVAGTAIVIHRNEPRLTSEAERAIPGSLIRRRANQPRVQS